MRTFAQKQNSTQKSKTADSARPSRTLYGQSHEVRSILHLQRMNRNQTMPLFLQVNHERHDDSPVTSASPYFEHDFSRIPLYAKAQAKIQPKLTISIPGDVSEQEADQMAEFVTQNDGSPEQNGILQRKCASCEAATSRADVNGSGSQALDPGTKAFMGRRFGTDFSNVRIHTDNRAARLSQGLHARAFTYGSDIYFNRNQYAPDTTSGRKLLAHELTHAIQQSRGESTGIQRDAIDDARLDDPNFLICLALTYIGLPPGIWRTLVNQMLRAVSEQYREQYGEERGTERFAEFSAGYSTWSLFNKVKAVLTFVGESRIGPMTIRLARAQAVRAAALRALERAGFRTASVIAASQIIRKVSVYLELAWAAGCFLYCTAEQYAIFIRDLSMAVISAVARTIQTISQIVGPIGEAVREAISQAIRVAQAKMDTTNWIYASEVPRRARRHFNMIVLSARLASDTNTYLSYLGRPLNNYEGVAPLLLELAEDLNNAMQSRGGFSQLVTFTPDFLGGLTPLTLLDLMIDYRFIRFRRSPEELAAEASRLEQEQETASGE